VKEPHGQGRGSHPGPESCGEARKGVAEALTAGSAGERSSREITTSTVPALLGEAEGNTGGDAIASGVWTPTVPPCRTRFWTPRKPVARHPESARRLARSSG
jgi:hypothetical protein